MGAWKHMRWHGQSSSTACWQPASRKLWNCPLSLRRQICWAVVDIVCLTRHTDVRAMKLRLPEQSSPNGRGCNVILHLPLSTSHPTPSQLPPPQLNELLSWVLFTVSLFVCSCLLGWGWIVYLIVREDILLWYTGVHRGNTTSAFLTSVIYWSILYDSWPLNT